MSNRKLLYGSIAVALCAGGAWLYLTQLRDDAQPPEPDEPGADAVLWPWQEVASSKAQGVRRIPPKDDGDPGMLRAMKRAIGRYDGPIAYLGERMEGDRRFGSLEKRIRSVGAAAFETRDSTDALAALRELRAEYLIVSQLRPDIPPWPARSASKLRDLLRDVVPPPSFQPVVIGRAHVLYRVTPPFEIPAAARETITKRVRKRLAGNEGPRVTARPSPKAVGFSGYRVFVSVRGPDGERGRGRPIARGLSKGDTLQAAIDAATDEIRAKWAEADRFGLPEDVEDALPRLRVQVDVVHRAAEITDREMEEDRLFRILEIGRHGVYLARRARYWAIPPVDAVHREIPSATRLVERIGSWHGLGDDAWKDRRYGFGRFETLTWIERSPGGSLVDLYRGLPLVTFADVTRERLVESLRLGAKFLVRNQLEDGQFRYWYRPLNARGKRWTRENNIVRHGLNPYTVLLVHGIEPDPSYVSAAHAGLGYTFKHLRRFGNRCHVWHQDDGASEPNAKMGTVAVTILSLIKLAEVADISEYEDELDCLGEQLLFMQEESGDVRQYDVPSDHGFYRTRNTIFPGEIMFAFSRLYGRTRDERYKRAFDALTTFQERWFARLLVETEPDGIYDERRRVDLISFEPWGIMALDDMHRQTGEARYVDFAFQLAEFMDGTFQWDLDRSQYPDYVGGYFKTQLELPAINSCGYSEGAAAAFAIAVRASRKVEERRRVILMGLRFALQLQYPSRDLLYFLPDPDTALGGYRYNLNRSRVRNDYMYHSMSAIAQGVLNLRPEDYPARNPIRDVPEVLRAVAGE